MQKCRTVRARTAVHEGEHPPCEQRDGSRDGRHGAVRGPGAPREAGVRAEGELGVMGFGSGGGGGGDGGGGKSERRRASSGQDDARAAGPVAGTERRSHGPGGCGHHIMLACAARREVLGRGAEPLTPEAAYSYNGNHGSSRTGIRRRDDDNRGEAAGNAS